jgi:hypothetical protein
VGASEPGSALVTPARAQHEPFSRMGTVVSAPTKAEAAVERLDEKRRKANRSHSFPNCSFTLTDEGRLALEEMGEATEGEIFELRYPELDRALALGSDVAGSVNRERTRVPLPMLPTSRLPETELSRVRIGSWTCWRRSWIGSCPLQPWSGRSPSNRAATQVDAPSRSGSTRFCLLRLRPVVHRSRLLRAGRPSSPGATPQPRWQRTTSSNSTPPLSPAPGS